MIFKGYLRHVVTPRPVLGMIGLAPAKSKTPKKENTPCPCQSKKNPNVYPPTPLKTISYLNNPNQDSAPPCIARSP